MGRVLQVFQLKGTRNEINRNDSTFYEIYTFYLEKKHHLNHLFHQSKLYCNLIKTHDAPLNENVQIIQVACALHPAVLSCHYPHSYSTLIEIYQ